jgi:PrgI family protein
MSTYKVLQDVEAEDKLIGPLSLRQFIYAGISAICLYLCYFFSTHHAVFLVAVFFPIAVVGTFFAFPWGKDQPTEVWALAKIRFLIKPRRRIWDQSGVKELVTITAPMQTHMNYTNGLSQTEVESRLRALADTIDSRGWAVKNANLNLYSQNSMVLAEPTSDRLLNPSSLPQPVESVDVRAADDILDEANNASAQRLDTMINQSAKAHRDRIVQNLQQDVSAQPAPPKPANYWFLNQPTPATNIPSNMVTFNTQVVTPGSAEADANAMTEPVQDEANIVAQLDARKQQSPDSTYYGHLHTIQPLSAQTRQQPQQQPAPMQPQVIQALPDMPAVRQAQPVTTTSNEPPATPVTQTAQATPPPVTPVTQAAILQLASNDDLNVATIAREAERAAPQNEVVIKLH